MLKYKNIHKKKFKKIILKSNSISDICREMKMPITKRTFDKIRELLLKFNININHFDKNKWHKRKYRLIERKCILCDAFFKVSEGSKKNNKIYCSRQCANRISRTKKERNKCVICNNKVKKNRSKFCSQKCRGRNEQLKTFKKVENGTYTRKSKGNGKNKHFKLYLIEKFGYGCMICERKTWMEKPIPLQVDHKDGNSDNDHPENLRNVCPNCHAQTSTYCGKNKGRGKRKYRLNDYKKGKNKW